MQVGIISNNQNSKKIQFEGNNYSLTFRRELHKFAKDAFEKSTPEGDMELLKKYRLKGDVDAKLELIKSKAFAIMNQANKLFEGDGQNASATFNKEDLYQEGFIGLDRAIDKFPMNSEKPLRGYLFASIKYAMTDAILETAKIIRLPQNIISIARDISKVSSKVEQKLGKEPNLKEISDVYKESPQEKIKEILTTKEKATVFSPDINKTRLGDGFANFDDFVSLYADNAIKINPEEELQKNILIKELNKGLEALTHQEKTVITDRYFNNKPYEYISEDLGITYYDSKKIEASAFKKLKKHFGLIKVERENNANVSIVKKAKVILKNGKNIEGIKDKSFIQKNSFESKKLSGEEILSKVISNNEKILKLMDLSNDEMQILALHYIKGYKYNDIQNKLGVGVNKLQKTSKKAKLELDRINELRVAEPKFNLVQLSRDEQMFLNLCYDKNHNSAQMADVMGLKIPAVCALKARLSQKISAFVV